MAKVTKVRLLKPTEATGQRFFKGSGKIHIIRSATPRGLTTLPSDKEYDVIDETDTQYGIVSPEDATVIYYLIKDACEIVQKAGNWWKRFLNWIQGK